MKREIGVVEYVECDGGDKKVIRFCAQENEPPQDNPGSATVVEVNINMLYAVEVRQQNSIV